MDPLGQDKQGLAASGALLQVLQFPQLIDKGGLVIREDLILGGEGRQGLLDFFLLGLEDGVGIFPCQLFLVKGGLGLVEGMLALGEDHFAGKELLPFGFK